MLNPGRVSLRAKISSEMWHSIAGSARQIIDGKLDFFFIYNFLLYKNWSTQLITGQTTHFFFLLVYNNIYYYAMFSQDSGPTPF